MKSRIGIGIIGFGTVGSGVVKLLRDNGDELRRRLGMPIDLIKVADLDTRRDRGVTLPSSVLTDDANEVLTHPDVDVVVELIGGLEPAKQYILTAMARGKHVVTANKALLAASGEDLFAAAATHGVDFEFEGSVGGGIPIVRALKEGLSANRIESIYGIINGTSNFILTKMTDERKPFAEVLAEAQRAGYAEADPTSDIEGLDSANKLAILVVLAFGTPVNLKEIYTEGITGVTPLDIEFAREFGYRIKLLAIAKAQQGAIEARVHPTMIPEDYLLAQVGGVFNAIYVVGDYLGQALFYGRGAGDQPTASAVVSDVIEIGRNIRTGVVGRVPPAAYPAEGRRHLRLLAMDEITSLYYLRFAALDHPGVLSTIAGVLGKYNISISSVIQKGRKAGGGVPVVMMTHRARERDVRQALAEIDGMSSVLDKTVLIRVEGEGD
ncbi:MAG: homoserine dehydrogenase [Nitrospirae bacterium]|nr:homoserine dehydrogenase [Nitrospirota bacterium]